MEDVVKFNIEDKGKHAYLSPSASGRWLRCGASVQLEQYFGSGSTLYTNEGSLAHKLAHLQLLNFVGKRKKLMRFAGTRIQVDAYDEEEELRLLGDPSCTIEMRAAVNAYVDTVKRSASYNTSWVSDAESQGVGYIAYPTLLPEVYVDVGAYVPGSYGRCDAVMISERAALMEVFDFKYGVGVPVEAKGNTQLMMYALGLLDNQAKDYDVEMVQLTIVQPRLGSTRSHMYRVSELRAWGDDVLRRGVARALDKDAQPVPGAWCRFCRAAARCSGLEQLARGVLDYSHIDARLISDEDALKLYKRSGEVTKFLGELSEHILNTAMEGKEWEGLKVVAGRSLREWSSEEEAKTKMHEKGYDEDYYTVSKFMSVAQLEKKMGKEDFSKVLGGYVHKPLGKPTLVVDDDKREPYPRASVYSDFEPVQMVTREEKDE